VCVYDRAGRGWSETADTRQDAAQIAADLHTLLHRAHVPGPYVLAGHSFGGLYALTFTARYPDEVAGMVLVDSTAPAPAPRFEAAAPQAPVPSGEGPGDLADRVSTLVSSSARLGLGRPIGVPTTAYLRSTIGEYGLGGTSARQAAALQDFAGKPLAVLTAGTGHDADESAAHDAMATLSTDSVHRVIDGVDHSGMVGDAQGAAATARAVLDVVSAVRTGQPLAD
jgi:pimeloyl-ACP methyl ester carboxylesterase